MYVVAIETRHAYITRQDLYLFVILTGIDFIYKASSLLTERVLTS